MPCEQPLTSACMASAAVLMVTDDATSCLIGCEYKDASTNRNLVASLQSKICGWSVTESSIPQCACTLVVDGFWDFTSYGRRHIILNTDSHDCAICSCGLPHIGSNLCRPLARGPYNLWVHSCLLVQSRTAEPASLQMASCNQQAEGLIENTDKPHCTASSCCLAEA